MESIPPASSGDSVSARLRAGLAAKACLLVGLAILFAALCHAAASRAGSWPLGCAAALLFGAPAPFLLYAASLAVADVIVGRAVRAQGAIALAVRWSGYSLRLPSGRFVEFLLFNPRAPLRAGHRYSVVYARYSGVLVAPPVEECEAGSGERRNAAGSGVLIR